MTFPFYKQLDEKDCGPTCLRMVAKYYKVDISIQKLKEYAETSRRGSSLHGIANAAEKIGFKTLGVKIDFQKLEKHAIFPAIVYWNKKHFVVVYKIKGSKITIADPDHGLIKLDKKEFIRHWIGGHANEQTEEGIVLLLEETPELMKEHAAVSEQKLGVAFLLKYFLKYRKLLFQLGLGLFSASILQLLFPFLTQSIVDVGIGNKDIHFLYLVLLGQLFVFLGRSAIEITRSWILLHVSSRINIQLVSDFLVKLMKLPISYFDAKMTGDILQRINDHNRIEELLTNHSLNTLFSVFNFLVFGGILILYDIPIFLIFLAGTALYFFWISFFMKKREDLDYKYFSHSSDEGSKIVELIQTEEDIKLNNAERNKR